MLINAELRVVSPSGASWGGGLLGEVTPEEAQRQADILLDEIFRDPARKPGKWSVLVEEVND